MGLDYISMDLSYRHAHCHRQMNLNFNKLSIAQFYAGIRAGNLHNVSHIISYIISHSANETVIYV